ncbi:DUF3810 domain-containing protein [Myroides odoratus]|uniref:DUF3810 domain-containing protein n=1 Tax=Myroides odoratus TaxID=256 RepID=UPI000765FE8D|nr:DUF3810 domain-containing protein [Myroides odoratus]
MRPIKLRFYLVGFVAFLLLKTILTTNPQWVERFYTHGFYAFYLRIITTCTNLFPFSIGDVLYFAVGLFLCWKIRQLWKKNQETKQRIRAYARLLIKGCFLFYVAFTLFWGLNNYRIPLATQLDLQQGYTKQELLELTKAMIQQTNTLQLAITQDSLQAVVLPADKEQIRQDAQFGVQRLSEATQWFTYRNQKAKGSLYSLPLTYMGFSGYINPFTLEAQVNTKIPASTLIVTSSHEIAHQVGYAKESEANFIGFLAAKKQQDIRYQYSANIFALRYCLKALGTEETEANFQALYAQIHPGVQTNLIENTLFWESYKTVTDSIFKFIYSNFLKINNQKEGIRSYNKFIDLLIHYNKKEPVFTGSFSFIHYSL